MNTFALLILGLNLAAPAQEAGRHRHPPQSAREYARALESPQRAEWQKPDQVVTALRLRPDEVIADIGAGTGYFARRFARHAGKVYAVDIDAALLERVRREAPPNLETVLAEPDDPKLPEAGVDTIFFCNVLHHIDNRPAYFEKLRRALRPAGRIVIIEFYKKELPVGPPVSMKLSEEEVITELREAGFVRTQGFDFLPYQYFLVFERR